MADLDDIREDVERAKTLDDYEGVEVLWVALIKAANLCRGRDELARMKHLVGKISDSDLSKILYSDAVDSLLHLDPPLETVLTGPHEVLNPEDTAKAVRRIQTTRAAEPREAILYLGEILKRIRNKRAHGFKSRKGPRDREILAAARRILYLLCIFTTK